MRLSFAVVLATGLTLALAAPSLPQGCISLSGVAYPNCTVLTDDVELTQLTVAAGEVKRFHWVMTNWAAINVPDSVRACPRSVVHPADPSPVELIAYCSSKLA